jgi:hypothetical protein
LEETYTDKSNIMNCSDDRFTHSALQEMWMPPRHQGWTVWDDHVWSTDYNKYYTANSDGTVTYSSSVFNRINDYMTQMQRVVTGGRPAHQCHNLSFSEFFFSLSS